MLVNVISNLPCDGKAVDSLQGDRDDNRRGESCNREESGPVMGEVVDCKEFCTMHCKHIVHSCRTT